MGNKPQHPAMHSLMQAIDAAQSLYNRLVIVVGEHGDGKTTLLSAISNGRQFPYINLGIELSRLLIDVSTKQSAMRLPDVMADIVGECIEKHDYPCSQSNNKVVLLDNTEILFDFQLRQDPIRLLQKLSRNTTLVASWTGRIENNKLHYASPQHPEYRQYSTNDLLVLDMKNVATF